MTKKMDGDITLTGTVSREYRKLLPRETVSSLSRFENIKNRLEVKNEVPRFGVNSESSGQNANPWLITMDGVVTPTGEAVPELTETASQENRESFDRELF